LSGDLDGNDNGNLSPNDPTRAENAYHVISSSSVGSAAILDGFTISHGNTYSPEHAGPDPEIKGGGIWNVSGSPTLQNLILRDNTGTHGGGMYSAGQSDFPSTPSLNNIVFTNNLASAGGGMHNAIESNSSLTNVTFSDNSAAWGGGMYNEDNSPTLTNVTFSENSAGMGGGIYNNQGSVATIYNSILYGNSGGQITNISPSNANVIYSIVQNGYPGAGNLVEDPLLGPLQDNGGFTPTMALEVGSRALDAGNDANCPATDQRGVTRPQGSHCDIGAYEYEAVDSAVDVFIEDFEVDSYVLSPHESQRRSFAGMNSGPVKIVNTHGVPIMAAERVVYKVKGVNTSFTEMTGLPANQLDMTYWLPWYNNLGLDTQLRFANVSNATASVHVYIGEDEMDGSPFTLLPGASMKKSFPGIDDGPVKIESTQNIVAAARLIYKVSGANTSFSEIMALPASQLDTTYWLPWYNNTGLDTQLRFANVTDQTASVHIYIGGEEMIGSPFTLQSGESTRKSFSGIDDGPVQIVSDQNIVVAERIINKVNGIPTNLVEMMALPNSELDTTYWLPWYNNIGLDSQLRFANTTDQTATVHIFVGEEEMQGSPFTLQPGESTRKSFAGTDDGPAKVVSNVPVVVAERVIYTVNGEPTSFSEMMALPNDFLDATYWFPWYNNIDLDTQLRFGVP
jgi:uncharacterized protein YcfL